MLFLLYCNGECQISKALDETSHGFDAKLALFNEHGVDHFYEDVLKMQRVSETVRLRDEVQQQSIKHV